MHEITKYHNDLNSLVTRKWKAEELNVFFSIITKAKGKGTREFTLDGYELKELIDYSGKSNKRLESVLESLGKHLADLKYIERTENSLSVIVLFQKYTAQWDHDKKNVTVKIKVAEEFQYIVNNLNANFTRFELEEFVKLKSTYAKNLYRLLKQYRTTGERYFDTNEFKELMAIPKTYSTGNIQQKVIKPCMNELKKIFSNLEIEVIKSKGQGTPITAYKFTWKPEEIKKYSPINLNSPKKKKQEYNHLPDWYSITEVEYTPEELEEIEKFKAEHEKARQEALRQEAIKEAKWQKEFEQCGF